MNVKSNLSHLLWIRGGALADSEQRQQQRRQIRRNALSAESCGRGCDETQRCRPLRLPVERPAHGEDRLSTSCSAGPCQRPFPSQTSVIAPAIAPAISDTRSVSLISESTRRQTQTVRPPGGAWGPMCCGSITTLSHVGLQSFEYQHRTRDWKAPFVRQARHAAHQPRSAEAPRRRICFLCFLCRRCCVCI